MRFTHERPPMIATNVNLNFLFIAFLDDRILFSFQIYIYVDHLSDAKIITSFLQCICLVCFFKRDYFEVLKREKLVLFRNLVVRT